MRAAQHPYTRSKWIKRERCFIDDCIACHDRIPKSFIIQGGVTLLDYLDMTTFVQAQTEYGWIPVNLDSLRRFHAPNWMKTVAISHNNHGAWSSVTLRYATSIGISEPMQPGCIPTKLQRILVQAQDGGASITGQGRPLDRTYDPNIIKLWHATCSTKHSTSCHPQSKNGIASFPAKLKLIDVEDWSIVSIAPGLEPDYVALSYVWGNYPQPKLGAKTAALWSTANALRLHVTLPQTIEDAIGVVREIGMRFLWVDALCIVQDVPEEQVLQIRQMDRIYSRASLTLVSTSHSSRSGLPGVSRPWKITHAPRLEQECDGEGPYRYGGNGQHRALVEGFQLSWCKIGSSSVMEVLEDPEAWLKDSIWRQRGWTFQEELFSNRVVYFLENNLLFRCGGATWRADIALEDLTLTGGNMSSSAFHDDYRHRVHSLIRKPYATGRLEAIDLFRKLVHVYMIRQLTREDDIEKAFSGVANALLESVGPLYRGIPEKVFGEVIEGCWSWDLLLARRHGFPTWSWTGWTRQITIPDPDYEGSSPSTISVAKSPEIGIDPARALEGNRPLLRFFRLSRDARSKALFTDDSVRQFSPGEYPFDHFVPDLDEIQGRHQHILALKPGLMEDYLAFFTSLAFLCIKPSSKYLPLSARKEEEIFTVYQREAKDKRLTTIRLRSDQYFQVSQEEGRIYPFFVTLESKGGFQLMMVEFVDGIAHKVNVTAPGEPVAVEDWKGVGAVKTLIVMG